MHAIAEPGDIAQQFVDAANRARAATHMEACTSLHELCTERPYFEVCVPLAITHTNARNGLRRYSNTIPLPTKILSNIVRPEIS